MGWRAVTILIGLLGAQMSIAATRDEADIQRWINRHAQRSNSDEVKSARSSVVGDLDGDTRKDMAVLYTLQPRGQRSARRYLAVFKREREGVQGTLHYHTHMLVGGGGAAEANRATILNKIVVLEMLTHRAGDAECCPTSPSTRRYRLAPRGLTLVREPVKSKADAS
jgi:hypothetical protein